MSPNNGEKPDHKYMAGSNERPCVLEEKSITNLSIMWSLVMNDINAIFKLGFFPGPNFL